MPFTPAYVAPTQKERGQYSFSWLRILVIGVMLSVLVACCLYLHHTAFVSLQQGLTDGEHKNSAWIAGEIGYMLPFLVICIFQYAVYHKHDRHNGILQKEMAWEIAIVTLLTYAVLLPVVYHISHSQLVLQLAADGIVSKNAGDVYQTLFMDLAEWFLRLTVPLMLLLVFHIIKARSEIKYPEMPATPTTTTTAEQEA